MRYLSLFGLLIISAAFFLFSCSSEDYIKTKSGLIYKIEKKGTGPQLKAGDIIKFHLKVFFKDSLAFNSYNDMPQFTKVDSLGGRYDITEVFPKLHVGDSVLIIQTIDSILSLMGKKTINNKTIDSVVPGMKKGDKITYHVVVLEKYDNMIAYQEAYQKELEAMRVKEVKEMEQQKPKDIAEIERHLKEKKINAVKTESGTFVEIINPGQPPLPDSGKIVAVWYTGMTLDGKKFDSNIDTAFRHNSVFTFVIGQMGTIQGFEDGVKQIGKGGKVRIYIPSVLAYGKRGSPPTIKPYENLIFEVEIVDISDAPKSQPMPDFDISTEQTPTDSTKNLREK